ncbi:MAG: M42 family peptidase [Ruminococcus sp.]|nr:M42 family peptidase [Ruminococcus sp.]
MNKENLTELIIKLADIKGISGDEKKAAEECAKELEKYTENVKIKGGNVFAEFGKREEGKPHLLIDAHIDRVGLVVTSSEKGFAKAGCVGGLDRRLLPAQRVTVHSEKGDIPGVICTLPPHLAKDTEVMKKDSIYIDLLGGEAQPGDCVSFDTKCERLLNGRICGGGLDDRCGAAAVIGAAALVKERRVDMNSLPCSFTVLLSEQEEVGERGAQVGGFEIDPDIAIAVDVSFGMSNGENADKCGELGKGCMIGISPCLDRELSKRFIRIAEEKNMPYQREIMSGLTGTDADRLSVSRGGARAVTLSIPLRYMHTPAEVIDVSDCLNTAELIAEYILKGEY